ncbi:MAG: phage fiber-tail adaptor protein [Acidiferrobacteraceae bacterium]
MSTRVALAPKLVGETATYTFDFLSRLAVGETISTQVCAATVYSGVDASPSSIISGSATASGSVVSQNITAGVAGVIYQIVCTITTSASQTLLLQGYLAVLENLP